MMAIPDPHIERWLLVDSQAFKTALGHGCKAPNQKCEKDRYKQLLSTAVSDAGVAPLFGGIEHAEAIAEAIDLHPGKDASLDQFIQDLRNAVRNL